MGKTLISSAYIYPICPLSINHARMFVVGDIVARYARSKGDEVFFPIASHYSGNTAHKIAAIFLKHWSKSSLSEDEKKILNLYKNIYHLPNGILKTFVDPMNILDFYNRESLWELRSLGVSGDYEYAYTTGHEDFPVFINTVIALYTKNGFLVRNKKEELALDYDNEWWKKGMAETLEETEFIQAFHKNNVLSAVSHIRNDWGFLRDDGFGVTYENTWIIDPMFDSELFTIFDLYIRFKKDFPLSSGGAKEVFENLFEILSGQGKSSSALVDAIVKWLPCDVFVCEEHLKNWVIKKLYAESALLAKKYRTRKYFMLWMGLLNGVRMSASRGTAILANDLVNEFGGIKARLIILLCWGHPSKGFEYDIHSPKQADKLLETFSNYYNALLARAHQSEKSFSETLSFEDLELSRTFKTDILAIRSGIDSHVEKGYYRQALIEFLSVLPSKYQTPTPEMAKELVNFYTVYLEILLPGMLENFQ